MSSTRASIHTDERLQYRPKRCEFHSFDKLLRHRENVFDSQFEVDIRSREPEQNQNARVAVAGTSAPVGIDIKERTAQVRGQSRSYKRHI